MSWKFAEYPANWDEISHNIRAMDGFRCRQCGDSSSELNVHHITPLSAGGSNDPENLITLCKFCHAQQHNHMRSRVAYSPDLPDLEYYEQSKTIDFIDDQIDLKFDSEYGTKMKKLERNIYNAKASTSRTFQMGLLIFVLVFCFSSLLLVAIEATMKEITFTILALGVIFLLYITIFLFTYIGNSRLINDSNRKIKTLKLKKQKLKQRIRTKTVSRMKTEDNSRFCPKCESLMYSISVSRMKGYHLYKCKKCNHEKELIVD